MWVEPLTGQFKMLQKRGYFFVLDSILSMFIIITGGFFILSSYSNLPETTQVSFLSDDLLKFISNLKIKDLNNPYAGIGGQLWQQGLINNSDNTLLQQLAIFYSEDQKDIAKKFIASVTKDVIPTQFFYEVWLNNEIFYPEILSPEHIQSKDKTKLMLKSNKIVFGIIDKETNRPFGPYGVEIYVWE